MPGIHEQAEVLMSLLVLGGAQVIPDHAGILDRALNQFQDELPATLELSFSTTSVGLRCFELPGILLACGETGMVEWQLGDMRLLKPLLPVTHAAEIAFEHGAIPAFQLLGSKIVSAMQIG
jgi:hypothetical protein